MKDEKASRGGHYEEWMNEQTRKKKGVIAIVNANENKYTETFVRQHQKLPFFIHYYFGTDFPIWHNSDGNLISNNEIKIKKVIDKYIIICLYFSSQSFVRPITAKNITNILNPKFPPRSDKNFFK